MTEKTLYRNVLTLIVLSDRPIESLSLNTIINEGNEGDMILGAFDIATMQIGQDQMAQELVLAGCDSSFFLDEY